MSPSLCRRLIHVWCNSQTITEQKNNSPHVTYFHMCAYLLSCHKTVLHPPSFSFSHFCFFHSFFLAFSSPPLGEWQRRARRSAVCLTFEVGLLCRARPATCWLCVCACVMCVCVYAEVNLSNFDEQRQQRSHHGDVMWRAVADVLRREWGWTCKVGSPTHKHTQNPLPCQRLGDTVSPTAIVGPAWVAPDLLYVSQYACVCLSVCVCVWHQWGSCLGHHMPPTQPERGSGQMGGGGTLGDWSHQLAHSLSHTPVGRHV